MTVSEANEVLLANAYCTLSLCPKCPYYNTKKCEEFSSEMLSEAINIIMEDMKNETGI